MNGIHDLGGMHGMGSIDPETAEPVFHETWEGRVYAMNRVLSLMGKWNIDASRYGIELLPPVDYLRMSYYEKWLARNIELLIQRGVVTRQEIETGQPDPATPKPGPALTADAAARIASNRGSYLRPAPPGHEKPQFKVGALIRAKD
jgi:nitrile hydratase